MKNKKMRHIIAMGFTMFAAWFGAGNLIFPPYLGNMAGNQWFIGFIGFFIMDVGLALLSALMAIGQLGHDLYWTWPGDSKMCGGYI